MARAFFQLSPTLRGAAARFGNTSVCTDWHGTQHMSTVCSRDSFSWCLLEFHVPRQFAEEQAIASFLIEPTSSAPPFGVRRLAPWESSAVLTTSTIRSSRPFLGPWLASLNFRDLRRLLAWIIPGAAGCCKGQLYSCCRT